MIQNRINYEKNKRKSIRELCENVLDVAIELKPMRMRANVVEHAVLKEKVDIDVAHLDLGTRRWEERAWKSESERIGCCQHASVCVRRV